MAERVANRARTERLVGRWKASGELLSGFARRQGISRDKLQYWSRKLAGALRDRAAEPELIPVRLVGGSEGRPAAVEVVLASGDRMLVREGASPELVQTVLVALRERC